MTTPPDDVDRQIVALLRQDARMSMSEVAKQANISRANAYRRLEQLRRRGIITGFTATIDPHAYGYEVSAYIELKIRQRSWKSVRRQLEDIPEIEHAGLVSGDFDIVLLVRATDTRALRNLVLERLQAIPEVLATQTIFIFDENSFI